MAQTVALPISQFFSSTPIEEVPRLAISIEALDKCGKTHYAIMTAPDPIAVVSNDPGTAAVVAKARDAKRKIEYMDLTYPAPEPGVKSREQINAAEWAAWVAAWEKFKNSQRAIIADKKIRTVVWDTASDIWHLAELAIFGKLQGNARQDLRTTLNADFTKVYWDLYKLRPDLNIILIHKQKKRYTKNSKGEADWDGGYELDGFSRINYAVDMTVKLGWDKVRKDFYSEVDGDKATRFGTDLVGRRWYSKPFSGEGNSSFVDLALEVFPNTIDTPEIWGL
jgi:AAA domain